MKTEGFIAFLKREIEVLDEYVKGLSDGEYPDAKELRLKEVALESALDFYSSYPISRISKINDSELSEFLVLYYNALKMIPLTPIQEEGFWKEVFPGLYTNERYQPLQKLINPETGAILYTDDTRFMTCNIRNLQRHFPDSEELKILMDLYPITFPYTPLSKPIVLYVDDNGITKHVMYARNVDGYLQEIKRMFVKKSDTEWEEPYRDKC